MSSPPLPIDAILPRAVQELDNAGVAVVTAAPGAGKTTRLPAALLDAGIAGGGEILVLEPRRLPSRLAATFVAGERGEAVGDRVGYSVRYEERGGPRTRLRYVTEGVFLRRLQADPRLAGVGVVILDEFHERHLEADLALALTWRLRNTTRPDLRLCVMSATLDVAPIAAYLGGCAILTSAGRVFEIAIGHAETREDRPLHEQVARAVRRLLREGLDGDVLVFLPGAAEIRRAGEALAALARAEDLLVVPLHGDLPSPEQDRAVAPAGRRKVILSTNVAESSVTIPGVAAVIDSGLARVARHDPWSGLPRLAVEPISQASAAQRAGRAGRTRAGRALRLYTKHDLATRPAFDPPEIERLDLAGPLLTLHAIGIREAGALEWLDSPPGPALAAARELLDELGALAPDGALTERGRAMARWPVHPRLARVLTEASARGVLADGCALAAILSEGDIAEGARVTFDARRAASEAGVDLLERLDRFKRAIAGGAGGARRVRGLAIDAAALARAERAWRHLLAVGGKGRSERAPPIDPVEQDRRLAQAVLTGFPDRVLRRRSPRAAEALLPAGGTAEVEFPPNEEWLVAPAIDERGAGGGTRTRVRLAVGIEPAWLIDVVPHRLRETEELALDDATGRVERVSRLTLGSLALHEAREPAAASPEAARLLARALRNAAAHGTLASDSAAGLPPGFGARLAFLRRALPEEELQGISPAEVERAIEEACAHVVTLDEARASLAASLAARVLSPRLRRLLDEHAPARVKLPSGREVAVHYDADRPPWIESRLQDFFGLHAGPAVARGRVPLTLHLLAPNGRAVQVTTDLAGFWARHYPALRPQLSRRYPRHAWPEDGTRAVPPAFVARSRPH